MAAVGPNANSVDILGGIVVLVTAMVTASQAVASFATRSVLLTEAP